jgi:DNA-binding transcriptional ArsR family regulator
MASTADFATTAALMGDPVRAQILGALMVGRALTASELACEAGIAPQTASGHLSKLAAGGLIAATQQGRFRYYRIASSSVAQAVEHLWALAGELASPNRNYGNVVLGPRDAQLRTVRTCYDHLAGALAVRMTDSLVDRGLLEMSFDGASLADEGVSFLQAIGVNLSISKASASRVFCRPCLDWSERRLHLAGEVGAALCRTCFEKGWLRRASRGPIVTVTPLGQRAIEDAFPLSMRATG